MDWQYDIHPMAGKIKMSAPKSEKQKVMDMDQDKLRLFKEYLVKYTKEMDEASDDALMRSTLLNEILYKFNELTQNNKYVRPMVVFALKRELICEWTDGEDGPCETTCGRSMDFERGGAKENQFKFCPYCGLRLVIKQAEQHSR